MAIPEIDLRLQTEGQPLDGRRVEAAQTRVLRETLGNVEASNMAEPNAYRVMGGYVSGGQTVLAPTAYLVRRPMRITTLVAQGIGAALTGTDYAQITFTVFRNGEMLTTAFGVVLVQAQNTLYTSTINEDLLPWDSIVVETFVTNAPIVADVWWHLTGKEEVR